MMSPLATVGYDHVVVIDTQVILETRPLVELPWSELFPGTVLLLVVRQVQTEIDSKKNDGRLGTRAREFNRLLDCFIEKRIPSSVLREPRIDVATVASRQIDWNALDDLERDDGDDKIIAQTLNAIVDDPLRLVVLSHDMRPRDAAHRHGLKAKKLPETWLRQPEPSPDQRQINQLKEKVRLLSSDQPQFAVRLEIVTPEPWRYRAIIEAAPEHTRNIIDQRLATANQQVQRNPFEDPFRGYDHSLTRRNEAWLAMINEQIPKIHSGLAKLFAQHRILVTVENTGSVSAEGLSLEIRSGNTVLHSLPYLVLLTGPQAPQPELMSGQLLGLNRVGGVPRPREPFRFYWDKRGPGDHLIVSCASFRQEKVHRVEASVELQLGSAPKAQIEAIVTASNMKGDARGQLLIDVARVTAPIGELIDMETFKLKDRLPFLPSTECDDDDLTLFQNDGSVHRKI